MSKFCSSCGKPLKADEKFCSSCGAPVDGRKSNITVNEPTAPRRKSSAGGKSKMTAALLAIFLGGLGAHKFYEFLFLSAFTIL